MNQAAAPTTRPVPFVPLLLAAAGGAFALAAGLAAGDPGSGMLLPVGAVLAVALVVAVVARPFAGFLALVFSVFLLVVVTVPGTQRNANVFDLVLIPLVATSLLGGVRGEAAAQEAVLVGPAHEAIRTAAHRFGNGALLYFGLAALSLLPMALRLGAGPALTSGLSLTRALMGALIFPLALWWLRDERRIDTTVRTVLVAAVALALANGVWAALFEVPRAGMVWWVAETYHAIGSPNEAATALLVLWALLQARWSVRPSRSLVLFMGLVVVMLPLTQSRSGILAFLTFLLLTVRHLRWRWILTGLLILSVALVLVPATFWDRMVRSLTFQRGSFEAFSVLIRFYGYRMAWHVFLDHPIFGVGYLGLRFVSVNYNELRLLGMGAENYMLETLGGLGLVGFAILCVVFGRIFVLGRVVGRSTPKGTFGHALGRFNAPLLVSLLVANLTATGFMGMAGVGQLAFWCALLVRAGHLAVPRAEPT